jgi:hypothetical protein
LYQFYRVPLEENEHAGCQHNVESCK